MKANLVDPDGVRLMKEQCSTCIFKPGNLMRLNAGRVKEMVDHCKKVGGTIPCHDTLDLESQAICRGFVDTYVDDIPLLQLAVRMRFVKEIEL